MVQSTGTGIGRALRSARLRQGKSLEEASRETRVRSDYLEALEREDFGRLQGDVYVRGFLGSYARYLGLSPEKVLAAYERLYRSGLPAPAPVEQAPGVGPTEAVILTGGHRRPSWLLAAAAAVIVLASAAAIGLFKRQAPPPATNPRPAPAAERSSTVRVDLIAVRDVEIEVRIDTGESTTEHLEPDEALSYEGEDRIDIQISDGGAVRMGVNGSEPVQPGPAQVPFEGTYFPSDFREEPSPSQATPGP
jgi:cytoskeletal protein RodZ